MGYIFNLQCVLGLFVLIIVWSIYRTVYNFKHPVVVKIYSKPDDTWEVVAYKVGHYNEYEWTDTDTQKQRQGLASREEGERVGGQLGCQILRNIQSKKEFKAVVIEKHMSLEDC